MKGTEPGDGLMPPTLDCRKQVIKQSNSLTQLDTERIYMGINFSNLAQDALNAAREADALRQQQEMAKIEHQEGENAIAGAKVNLAHNQMRRYNDGQKALGQLG